MGDRRRLTRADMSERRTEDVEVLDGFVTLRYPSVDDVLSMQKLVADGKQEEVAVKLILDCAIEEDGTAMFTEESQIRKELSLEAFTALAMACMKFIKPNTEDIAKN